jgi:hypothetical protein
MKNITLRNIVSHGGLLPPGVIRCHETNPCEGFVWDNVKLYGWWRLFGLGFITENVKGTVTESHPIPAFTNLASEASHCPFMALYEDIKDQIDHVLGHF